MGCQGGEWHIRKVWLTMPVAGAGLLPPGPVINVLSACNPTPTLNEARIYHLGRVADVRGKGIQVAGNNILFLACAWHVWQALKTTKKACVSTNFSRVTFSSVAPSSVQRSESRRRWKKTPSPLTRGPENRHHWDNGIKPQWAGALWGGRSPVPPCLCIFKGKNICALTQINSNFQFGPHGDSHTDHLHHIQLRLEAGALINFS